jgi:O-antigen ligase
VAGNKGEEIGTDTEEDGMSSLKTEISELVQEVVCKGRMSAALFLALSLFVFMNIFPHVTAIKEALYYFAVLAALLVVSRKREEISLRTPLAVPFLLFSSWSFLSSLLAVDRKESLYYFYNHLLEYVLLYYLVLMAFDSKRKFLFLNHLFVIPVALFSAASLSYFYLWQGNAFSARFGEGFTDSAINVMGYATVPAMLISGYLFFSSRDLRLRLLLVFSALLTAAASVLTQSRGTILAMIVGALVLASRTKKNFAFTALAIMLAVGVAAPLQIKARFTPDVISNDARLALARYATEVIKDYPVFGTGYAVDTAFESGIFPQEQYRGKLPAEMRERISEMDLLLPHNLLLNFAVRVGVPGILLFLGIFAVFVRMCFQLIRRGDDVFINDWSRCSLALFTVFFVKGLFEPITTHFVEVIYFTLLAMGTILWRLNRKGRSGSQPDTTLGQADEPINADVLHSHP